MSRAFYENPLLLLFTVIAIGYGLGSIRVRGTKLGVAAVLFVGLGFGALDPNFKVPEILIFLGLAIFVYTIGLSSGPVFFDTFKRRGFRDIGFILGMLALSVLFTFGLHLWFGIDAATSAGIFAGSSTNTPALAAILDVIQKTTSNQDLTLMSQRAVVGYSLSYPMGVLGVIFSIFIVQKMLKINYDEEEMTLQAEYTIGEKVGSRTIKIENPHFIGIEVRDILKKLGIKVVFGRLKRDGIEQLTNYDTVFKKGDFLSIIASEGVLDRIEKKLGSRIEDNFIYNRSEYDIRRLFVSNPNVAGESIASLNLNQQYSAVITRVQRGDIDLLAHSDTVLELGDRVLIVARRKDVNGLSKIFGNSLEALSHINLLSFGTGLAIGLILGNVNFSLPGGIDFNLGYAGGPLLVALVLGKLRRTGPIVWTPSYSANLTMRQFGLTVLLAGIGIRSGHTFLQTLLGGDGGIVFLAGTLVAIVSTLMTLIIGFKVMKIPFSMLAGMVGSQPAVLDYALEQSGNKFPLVGFTFMLPILLIAKILMVQVLYHLIVNTSGL